jgi:hypothetical protein
MKLYACAVTLIQHKGGGTLNVLTCLYSGWASNEDEARGRYFRMASESNPDHQIHTTVVGEVDTTPP